MRATRLSLMVLLVVLAFVLWNAAWVTDRCGEWTAALDEAEAALEQGGTGQQQLDALNSANTLREVRAKVSAATGVPADLLSGDTEEACTAQAQAALKFAKPVNSYPDVRDGEPYLAPSAPNYAAEAFRSDRKHTPRSYPHSIY